MKTKILFSNPLVRRGHITRWQADWHMIFAYQGKPSDAYMSFYYLYFQIAELVTHVIGETPLILLLRS